MHFLSYTVYLCNSIFYFDGPSRRNSSHNYPHMLIENSLTGKKVSHAMKQIFFFIVQRVKRENDFTWIVHNLKSWTTLLAEVRADFFFQDKLDPLDTFLHYLIFQRKLSPE